MSALHMICNPSLSSAAWRSLTTSCPIVLSGNIWAKTSFVQRRSIPVFKAVFVAGKGKTIPMYRGSSSLMLRRQSSTTAFFIHCAIYSGRSVIQENDGGYREQTKELCRFQSKLLRRETETSLLARRRVWGAVQLEIRHSPLYLSNQYPLRRYPARITHNLSAKVNARNGPLSVPSGTSVTYVGLAIES